MANNRSRQRLPAAAVPADVYAAYTLAKGAQQLNMTATQFQQFITFQSTEIPAALKDEQPAAKRQKLHHAGPAAAGRGTGGTGSGAGAGCKGGSRQQTLADAIKQGQQRHQGNAAQLPSAQPAAPTAEPRPSKPTPAAPGQAQAQAPADRQGPASRAAAAGGAAADRLVIELDMEDTDEEKQEVVDGDPAAKAAAKAAAEAAAEAAAKLSQAVVVWLSKVRVQSWVVMTH